MSLRQELGKSPKSYDSKAIDENRRTWKSDDISGYSPLFCRLPLQEVLMGIGAGGEIWPLRRKPPGNESSERFHSVLSSDVERDFVSRGSLSLGFPLEHMTGSGLRKTQVLFRSFAGLTCQRLRIPFSRIAHARRLLERDPLGSHLFLRLALSTPPGMAPVQKLLVRLLAFSR